MLVEKGFTKDPVEGCGKFISQQESKLVKNPGL